MSRGRALQADQLRRLLTALVEVRDEVAAAKDLVAAAYMAARALDQHSSERSALCAVTNAGREKLEAALDRLDQLLDAAK